MKLLTICFLYIDEFTVPILAVGLLVGLWAGTVLTVPEVPAAKTNSFVY